METIQQLTARIKSEVQAKSFQRKFLRWGSASNRPDAVMHNGIELAAVRVSSEEFSRLYNETPPENRQYSEWWLSTYNEPNLILEDMVLVEVAEKPAWKAKSALGSNPYIAARRLAWMGWQRAHPSLSTGFTYKPMKKLFNLSWWLFYKFNTWTLPSAPKIDDVYDRK